MCVRHSVNKHFFYYFKTIWTPEVMFFRHLQSLPPDTDVSPLLWHLCPCYSLTFAPPQTLTSVRWSPRYVQTHFLFALTYMVATCASPRKSVPKATNQPTVAEPAWVSEWHWAMICMDKQWHHCMRNRSWINACFILQIWIMICYDMFLFIGLFIWCFCPKQRTDNNKKSYIVKK